MEHADVLIVGAGPAGSACAARLVAAGCDVLVIDQVPFPRDKPCAGWITPDVLARVGLDSATYAARHTLEAISAFRVGRIGGAAVDVDYGRVVSYAIRRSELDAELLRRSGARTDLGRRVCEIRREKGRWVVNGRWSAPVLVGAGGHFCPVARMLRGASAPEATVVARQIEYRLGGAALDACQIRPERPELYFCADLLGYGWCVRKGDHLNLGLGRRDPCALPRHVVAFVDFLVRLGRIAPPPRQGWHGHAYLVRRREPLRITGEGMLLVGDAAGLAAPESGEGILPAVVSGQRAARAILEPGGLRHYAGEVAGWLGHAPESRAPGAARTRVGLALLGQGWFVRRVVFDRWFLHRAGRPGPLGTGEARCISWGFSH